MTAEENEQIKVKYHGGSSNPVYGLGLIGAWIYFMGRATTTEERVKGFFKAFVWPVFLVRDLFVFLEKK